MLERFWILLIGILLIAGGIHIFFSRAFYSLIYGRVDMGPYHLVVGVIFFIVGIIFVYTVTKALRRNRKKDRLSQDNPKGAVEAEP